MFGRKDRVQEWFATQHDEIELNLKMGLERALRWSPNHPCLDYGSRTLSEMELCGALELISLPKGYSTKTGIATIFGAMYGTHHVYGFSRSGNKVIDPCASQFFVRSSFAKRQAENMLIGLAPELFLVAGELAILYGSTDTIREKLGINYT